jgi:hypothetical protein
MTWQLHKHVLCIISFKEFVNFIKIEGQINKEDQISIFFKMRPKLRNNKGTKIGHFQNEWSNV